MQFSESQDLPDIARGLKDASRSMRGVRLPQIPRSTINQVMDIAAGMEKESCVFPYTGKGLKPLTERAQGTRIGKWLRAAGVNVDAVQSYYIPEKIRPTSIDLGTLYKDRDFGIVHITTELETGTGERKERAINLKVSEAQYRLLEDIKLFLGKQLLIMQAPKDPRTLRSTFNELCAGVLTQGVLRKTLPSVSNLNEFLGDIEIRAAAPGWVRGQTYTDQDAHYQSTYNAIEADVDFTGFPSFSMRGKYSVNPFVHPRPDSWGAEQVARLDKTYGRSPLHRSTREELLYADQMNYYLPTPTFEHY